MAFVIVTPLDIYKEGPQHFDICKRDTSRVWGDIFGREVGPSPEGFVPKSNQIKAQSCDREK